MIDVFLRQRWDDPRLTHSGFREIYASKKTYDAIWIPDTYILNEKKTTFHDLTVENTMVNIYPNGSILRSQRQVQSKAVSRTSPSSTARR